MTQLFVHKGGLASTWTDYERDAAADPSAMH